MTIEGGGEDETGEAKEHKQSFLGVGGVEDDFTIDGVDEEDGGEDKGKARLEEVLEKEKDKEGVDGVENNLEEVVKKRIEAKKGVSKGKGGEHERAVEGAEALV